MGPVREKEVREFYQKLAKATEEDLKRPLTEEEEAQILRFAETFAAMLGDSIEE